MEPVDEDCIKKEIKDEDDGETVIKIEIKEEPVDDGETDAKQYIKSKILNTFS